MGRSCPETVLEGGAPLSHPGLKGTEVPEQRTAPRDAGPTLCSALLWAGAEASFSGTSLPRRLRAGLAGDGDSFCGFVFGTSDRVLWGC